jgi:hypothetical protein
VKRIKAAAKSIKNDLVHDGKTDTAGVVLFQKVPVGQYTIKVTGTTEFYDSEKVVSLLNEEDKCY